MSFFQTFLKLFTSAWPMVREMVLNNESFMQVLKVNRRRAIFSVIVMASIIFSVVSLGADARFVSILFSYVKLEHQYQNLETKFRAEDRELHVLSANAARQTQANAAPRGNLLSAPPAPPAPVTSAAGGASGPVAALRAVLTDWSAGN